MSANWSRSAIDKLGDRLRNEEPIEPQTFERLQQYFATLEPFANATFERVTQVVERLKVEGKYPALTRRRIKTLTSMRDKLRRQSTALSQMQDIVGCRIVVNSTARQNSLRDHLSSEFGSALTVHDRRQMPKYGYRAVHAIIRETHHRFEIQIRTIGQDVWANIVERLADHFGIEIKYGGGSAGLQEALLSLSATTAEYDIAIDECRAAHARGDFATANKALDKADTALGEMQRQSADLGKHI